MLAYCFVSTMGGSFFLFWCRKTKPEMPHSTRQIWASQTQIFHTTIPRQWWIPTSMLSDPHTFVPSEETRRNPTTIQYKACVRWVTKAQLVDLTQRTWIRTPLDNRRQSTPQHIHPPPYPRSPKPFPHLVHTEPS